MWDSSSLINSWESKKVVQEKALCEEEINSKVTKKVTTEKTKEEKTMQEKENVEDKLSKIPPNFQKSLVHRNSTMMRNVDEKKFSLYTKCECCGNAADAPLFNFWDSPKEFAEYGFGISFIFISSSSYSNCFTQVMCLTGGIEGDTTEKVGEESNNNQFTFYFGVSNLYLSNAPYVFFVTTLLCVLFFFLAWIRFRTYLYNESMKLNIDTLTPGDYTCMIESAALANPKLNEKKLLKYIFPDEIDDQAIIRYCFSYHIHDYVQMVDKLHSLKKQAKMIEWFRKSYANKNQMDLKECQNLYPSKFCGTMQDYKSLLDQIADLEKKIYEIEQMPINKMKRGTTGFVTFNFTTICEDNVRYYSYSNLEYLCGRGSVKYLGHPLFIREAPEPEDVNWENLTIPFRQRMKRILITVIVTLFVLGACFVADLFIYKTIRNYADDDQDYYKIVLLNALASFLVIVVNQFLSILITIFTTYEKHRTTTEHQISISIKLIMATFINAGIVPLILFTDKSKYFGKGGLQTWVIMNWISIALFNPFYELFGIGTILRYIRRKFYTFQGDSANITQQEANQFYEPSQIYMPEKYSHLVLVVFYSAIYIHLFPIGIGFSICGLILTYIFDKYLMIRRYKRSERIGPRIAYFIINFISGFMVIILASNMFFNLMLGEGYISYIMAFLPLLICGIFGILRYALKRKRKMFYEEYDIPEPWIYKVFLGSTERLEFLNKFSHVPYDLSFFGKFDYLSYNPITRNKALYEALDQELKNAKSQEEIQHLEQLKSNFENNKDKLSGHTNIHQTYAPYLGSLFKTSNNFFKRNDTFASSSSIGLMRSTTTKQILSKYKDSQFKAQSSFRKKRRTLVFPEEN